MIYTYEFTVRKEETKITSEIKVSVLFHIKVDEMSYE